MDFFPDQETLAFWLIEYGPIALFSLLALEIIALPIPGEPLMIVTGVLLANGDLSIPPTLFAAYAGALIGISVSYVLGRTAGSYLVVNYGGRLGITNAKMQRVHDWFLRFGKWTLVIGYFIPGIRHFTGFSAGMAMLEYRPFTIFAYFGALFWVSIFISLGYFFGGYWMALFDGIISFFS